MDYRNRKERVVRIASQLFVDRQGMSASDVDRIIRAKLCPEILGDPTMAPDHIRVALVEYGLLTRTSDSREYSFNRESFLSPENVRGVLGSHYPVERITGLSHLLKKMAAAAKRRQIIEDRAES